MLQYIVVARDDVADDLDLQYCSWVVESLRILEQIHGPDVAGSLLRDLEADLARVQAPLSAINL